MRFVFKSDNEIKSGDNGLGLVAVQAALGASTLGTVWGNDQQGKVACVFSGLNCNLSVSLKPGYMSKGWRKLLPDRGFPSALAHPGPSYHLWPSFELC